MKKCKQTKDLPTGIVQGFDTNAFDSRYSIDGLVLVDINHVPAIFPDYFTTERCILQFLTQGEMHAQINLNDVHFKAPCAFVLMPDFVLHFDNASPDAQTFVVSFTDDFAEQMQLPELSYHIMNAILCNPVFQFTPEQMQTALQFYNLLKDVVVHSEGNPYALEATISLTRALIRYTQGLFPQRFEQPPRLRRAEELTNDFIAMAEKECVRQRSVKYYAEQLHVAPKYLANVVKEETGRTVGDWLNNYTLLRAKVLLTTSRLNIQQIAEALHFANQSHFGTWFRRYTGGIGPKDFRQGTEE